ncbi:MAG: bifunctional adenosylcobinamide kinase/adenosylcobinamide-phosphate guanylyltransferase [Rhodobacterales bacterium]|nr:MAG: bifunctional adenosylcobinamide kinase/adenosylcobinamide-phosphate guanylyltransferase [Rhodobacterales bacterium]
MTDPFPPLTLVLGGIASGKSDFAERLIAASGLPPTYIATAEARDAEMAEKISAHKARRGAEWRNLEAPMDLADAILLEESGMVLVDCLSMWLTNHLLAESDLEAEFMQLLNAIDAAKTPLVIVSNEVGLGGIAADTLTRRFAEKQGEINRLIAAQADKVVLVSAGIAQVLKGRHA